MTGNPDALAPFRGGAREATVAAFRCLAFLDTERRRLIAELCPEARRGDGVFIPLDAQVDALGEVGALDRAVPMLRAAGIDPGADDAWVGTMGKFPMTWRPPG